MVSLFCIFTFNMTIYKYNLIEIQINVLFIYYHRSYVSLLLINKFLIDN